MKKLILSLIFLLLLTACEGDASCYEADFFAMDTVMQVRIYDKAAGSSLAAEITHVIQDLENRLSVTKADSEIAKLNQGQAVALSSEVQELLARTTSIEERSNGLLDPTIYPIVKLWGFTTGKNCVPSQSEIEQALALTGMEHLVSNGNTLTLTGGTQLDFGAVAKGYAAEKCAEILSKNNISGILTLGGNIQTVGEKPDGSDWHIGITDPEQPENSLATLSFKGSWAVVTSGGYQRYFEEDGVRYSHIMDPRTGAPAQSGLSSVTVVAESGLLADGLSTALYVMGLEDAEDFWRTSDDFEAVLIEENGQIYVTEGLLDSFSCERDYQVIGR